MRQSLGILALLLSGLWLVGKWTLNNIAVNFDKLHFYGIDANTIKLQASLLIQNPLPVSVLVNELYGDVYIMGIQSGALSTIINQRIHANSISEFRINIDIFRETIGEAIWANIMTGDVRTLLVEFQGYIVVEGKQLPVKKTMTYEDLFGGK